MISQRGNVLFLILIAVALFAALSYAVTSSSRSGGGDASKETAHANAAAIIQYATSVKNAIVRIKTVNDCTDYNLDFSNPVFKRGNGTPVTTANVNAPSDKRCHIFDAIGGNVQPVVISPAALDTSVAIYSTSVKLGHSSFLIFQLKGLGTDGSGGTASANDLVLNVPYVNRQTCLALNDLLGVKNPAGEPPSIGWSGGKSAQYNSGDYSTATAIQSLSGSVNTPAYCHNTDSSLVPLKYVFDYALIER